MSCYRDVEEHRRQVYCMEMFQDLMGNRSKKSASWVLIVMRHEISEFYDAGE